MTGGLAGARKRLAEKRCGRLGNHMVLGRARASGCLAGFHCDEKVINIMDALKKSMQAKGQSKVREAVGKRMGRVAPAGGCAGLTSFALNDTPNRALAFSFADKLQQFCALPLWQLHHQSLIKICCTLKLERVVPNEGISVSNA
jgi:hypothetical protein